MDANEIEDGIERMREFQRAQRLTLTVADKDGKVLDTCSVDRDSWDKAHHRGGSGTAWAILQDLWAGGE